MTFQHCMRLCINVIHCYVVGCPRLSGESPFQGNSDAETLSLVTAARYEFDQESFEDISDQAKDFISSLLKKDRRLVLFSFIPPSLNDCCKFSPNLQTARFKSLFCDAV